MRQHNRLSEPCYMIHKFWPNLLYVVPTLQLFVRGVARERESVKPVANGEPVVKVRRG